MFQPDTLKGRAIFLSGGGSGLGKSMALYFASLGARMFLIGRREQPLEETCDEIRSAGGSAAFTTCDVRDYAAVEAAAEKSCEQLGRIDTVINNAAGNFMASPISKPLATISPGHCLRFNSHSRITA